MNEDLRKNLTASETWIRGLYILLFAVIYSVAETVLVLVVLFQFVHTLLAGKSHDALLDFSENLCAFIYEVTLFVSFNSDDRPFPFGPWPNEQTLAQEPLGDLDDDDIDDDPDEVEDDKKTTGAGATVVPGADVAGPSGRAATSRPEGQADAMGTGPGGAGEIARDNLGDNQSDIVSSPKTASAPGNETDPSPASSAVPDSDPGEDAPRTAPDTSTKPGDDAPAPKPGRGEPGSRPE